MVIKEKYPEYKAIVPIPGAGSNLIDPVKLKDINDTPFETHMLMSLEAAFLYMRTHARGFVVEHDRSKHDMFLPDEVRNYILDNQFFDPNLPD